MKIRMLLAALLLCAGNAHGQGIQIEGSINCGDWVKARKSLRASNFEHYFLGFINGISLGSGVEFWDATGSKLSREQIYLWMDNYCTKNPLRNVVTGTVDLINEHTQGAYDRSWRIRTGK